MHRTTDTARRERRVPRANPYEGRPARVSGRALAALGLLTWLAGCGGGGSAAVAPSTPAPPGPASVSVARVGPGTTDPSVHQLVRTRGDVLYVVAPDGTTYPHNPTAHLRVYRGDRAGAPASMAARDDGHAPGGGVNASDSAIDGQDRIHVVWMDGAGNVLYAPFDTATDLWGATAQLEASGVQGLSQGDEGVAIAVDAFGNPHAVWVYQPATNVIRVRYASLVGGAWSAPVDVADTVAINLWHPTLAFAPNGDLTVAWLDGTGGYSTDGVVRTRRRHANGTWDASQLIPDTAVVGLDNGPSLLITADGTRHIAFDNYTSATVYDQVRYWYDVGAGWQGDQQPPVTYSHDPALGPDGQGGLYLYAHGAIPAAAPMTVGQGKYRFHKAAGSATWGPFTLVPEAVGAVDDATSTRWSQFFINSPGVLDFTYWTHTDPADSMGYELFVATQNVP
jgi:hypothetical protein